MLTNRDLTNDALQILTMTRCEFFCSIFTLCVQYALLWPAKLVSQITKDLDSMSPIKRWVIQAIAQMIWWTIGTCITFYVYTILTNHFTPTTYYDNTNTETHLTNSLSHPDYYDNIQTNKYFPHNIDKRQTNPCDKPNWITNYLCNRDLSTPQTSSTVPITLGTVQTSSTVPITLSTVQTYSTIAITLSTVQISSKIAITLSTVQTYSTIAIALSTVQTYNTIVITQITAIKTTQTTTTTPIPTTTIKIPRTLSTTLTKPTVTKTTTTSTTTTVTYPKRNNVTQKVTPKNHTLNTHTVKYDAHIEIIQIAHICVTCVILLIIILAIIRNIRKRASKKNQRYNFISNHNYQYPMPGMPLDKIQNDIPTFKGSKDQRMPKDQIHDTNFAKIRRTNKGNTQAEPTPPPKLKTFDKTYGRWVAPPTYVFNSQQRFREKPSLGYQSLYSDIGEILKAPPGNQLF